MRKRKRRKRILACGIIAGLILGIFGCAGNAEVNGGENGAEQSVVLQGEDKAAAGREPESREENEMAEKRDRSSEGETVEIVGIQAHVKEINGQTLLISSDTDDFPGVFTVTGAGDMPEFSDLEGGASILILMRDLNGVDDRGYAQYEAEQIIIPTGDEEEVRQDILLAEVPELTLQDALSSQMASVSLRSGNYTWNVEENGEGLCISACGAAPLEAAADFDTRIRIPEYNGMNGAPYVFSAKISPDILVVRRWNADDIGKENAREEAVVKYYYKQPVLQLEAGKVYEFAAEWKEENKDKNGFYGCAAYVLVTE